MKLESVTAISVRSSERYVILDVLRGLALLPMHTCLNADRISAPDVSLEWQYTDTIRFAWYAVAPIPQRIESGVTGMGFHYVGSTRGYGLHHKSMKRLL